MLIRLIIVLKKLYSNESPQNEIEITVQRNRQHILEMRYRFVLCNYSTNWKHS